MVTAVVYLANICGTRDSAVIMGCGESKFDRIYFNFPHVGVESADYEALLLREGEVGQLYNVFMKIAPPGSRKTTVNHICAFLNIDAAPFITKVLGLNEGELVSFNTFVIGMWNFCTVDKNCLGENDMFVSFIF